MTLTPEQRQFRQMIEALEVAAPFWVAAEWDNGFAHCVEASICGAAALRTHKITARAVPCALLGQSPSMDTTVCLGLTARELHALSDPTQRPSPFPTAQWVAHVIIEAEYHGERAQIDLTLGQLRHSCGIEVPLTISCCGDGWMGFEIPEWRFKYVDSPRAEEIRKTMSKAQTKAEWVPAMETLIDWAIQCSLDPDRLLSALRLSLPDGFAVPWERVPALCNPAQACDAMKGIALLLLYFATLKIDQRRRLA